VLKPSGIRAASISDSLFDLITGLILIDRKYVGGGFRMSAVDGWTLDGRYHHGVTADITAFWVERVRSTFSCNQSMYMPLPADGCVEGVHHFKRLVAMFSFPFFFPPEPLKIFTG
jgi:hypothetical protein